MKKKFKTILLSLILLASCIMQLAAQEKVMEKSGKKPAWVNSVEKGYIIEMGKGVTADEAKDKAMSGVRESIIRSVAEQITATSAQSTVETRTGNTYQVSGDYASAILTRTAKMPFVKGISASKAVAFYWEKVRDKKPGSAWVNYHIKYPFSEAELGIINMDFEKDQKEKEMALLDICQVADNSANLNEIVQKYRELHSLIPQLEDPVKGAAMVCLAKYQGLLNSFSFQTVSSQPGLISYVLTSCGKNYRYTAKPLIRSNCAGSFNFTPSADTGRITYNFGGCYESQVNTIFVEYRFEDISIKSEFPVDIKAGSVEFALTGGFRLTETEGDSLYITKCLVGFSLNSKYVSDFRITQIILEFPGLNPVSFDGIDLKVSGKGIQALNTSADSRISKTLCQSKQRMTNLVSGRMEFRNLATGISGIYRFYNEKITFILLQK